MCIALFCVSLLTLGKAPLISLCCLVWAVFYFNKTKKSILQFRAFTLIELVAVLGLVAILAAITLSISTDKVKTESVILKSKLIQTQTLSYSMVGAIVPFEYEPKNYKSGITESHTLYFKDGVAVDEDGYPLIGFKLKVFDKYNKDNHINIYIKPFTGKITFY